MATPVPSGTLISHRFRIECLLEETLTETLYLAHDTLRKDAAVELRLFNLEGIAAEEHAPYARRLESQIDVLCRVEHPRLARLLACVDYQGQPGVVAESVPGERLKAWNEAPGSVEAALHASREVAEALLALHTATPPVASRNLQLSTVVRTSGGCVLTSWGYEHAASLMPGGNPGPASPPTAPSQGSAPSSGNAPIYEWDPDFGVSEPLPSVNSTRAKTIRLVLKGGTAAPPKVVQATPGELQADLYALGVLMAQILPKEAGPDPVFAQTGTPYGVEAARPQNASASRQVPDEVTTLVARLLGATPGGARLLEVLAVLEKVAPPQLSSAPYEGLVVELGSWASRKLPAMMRSAVWNPNKFEQVRDIAWLCLLFFAVRESAAFVPSLNAIKESLGTLIAFFLPHYWRIELVFESFYDSVTYYTSWLYVIWAGVRHNRLSFEDQCALWTFVSLHFLYWFCKQIN